MEREKAEYVEASPGASAIFGQADTELAVLHGVDRVHQVGVPDWWRDLFSEGADVQPEV